MSTILKINLSENTVYVEPLIEKKGLIAPTEEFEIEIIKTLTGRKILVPHVLSDLDAFDIEYGEEEGGLSYKFSVITFCENHGQRAIAQGWKLSHYSRIKDLPETYSSLVFLKNLLKNLKLK